LSKLNISPDFVRA